MADIGTLIEQMRGTDEFRLQANNPRVQFRNRNGQRLIGAELLPESPRELNQYDEEDIQLLDVVADDLGAYSPPEIKTGAARYVTFNVKMGDSGIAVQMSPKDYSELVRMLQRNPTMEEAANTILDFNGQLTRAMTTFNEIQRWAAILNGSVVRKVGNTTETITYPNYTTSGGVVQRLTISGAWSSNSYDPFDDLMLALDVAADLGYQSVVRCISGRNVSRTLASNELVARRTSNFTQILDATPGAATTFFDPPSQSKLAAKMADYGLPGIEHYDIMYADQDGQHRYIPDDCMIFVFSTARSNEPALEIQQTLNEPFIPDALNTIGYTGIGTTAGHEDSGPGRWTKVEFKDEARPHVFGEGVQKSLPVLTEPYGFLVYKGIH